MKWVVDKIGVEQIWYSGDVIEKIKKLCEDHISGKRIVMAQEVIDLIESEDK